MASTKDFKRGDIVQYQPWRFPLSKECGVVSSVNEVNVFVKYECPSVEFPELNADTDITAQATHPDHLRKV